MHLDSPSTSCGGSRRRLWAYSGRQHIGPQRVLQRAGERALLRLQAGAQAEQPRADALLLEPRRARRRHEIGPNPLTPSLQPSAGLAAPPAAEASAWLGVPPPAPSATVSVMALVAHRPALRWIPDGCSSIAGGRLSSPPHLQHRTCVAYQHINRARDHSWQLVGGGTQARYSTANMAEASV